MEDDKLTRRPYGVKVHARDDGKAECGTCHEGLDPAEVYWLLRAADRLYWNAFCFDRTRYFMSLLMAEVRLELVSPSH